jgi:dolichol-phosphate mannosyltransferase
MGTRQVDHTWYKLDSGQQRFLTIQNTEKQQSVQLGLSPVSPAPPRACAPSRGGQKNPGRAENSRPFQNEADPVSVSVVIPCRNEAGSIPGLLTEVAQAFNELSIFEIVVVDDGSEDETPELLLGAMHTIPNLRVLRHSRQGGQSAAVHSGVIAARYPIICTLDADGQNPPNEIQKLVDTWLQNEAVNLGLVAGQRVKRQDPMSRRLASFFANRIRALLLRDHAEDSGCGLKAFRRAAFLELPYFDHMHRYLPALFLHSGWKVVHVHVSHRERRSGRSHYSNLQRGLVGVVDLIGVSWLLRRRKKALATEIGSEVNKLAS